MRSLLTTCCGLLVLSSISPMALPERVGRTPPLEILGVERDGDGILVRGRNLGNCGLPELELGDLGPLVVESAEETLIVAELPGGILPAD